MELAGERDLPVFKDRVHHLRPHRAQSRGGGGGGGRGGGVEATSEPAAAWAGARLENAGDGLVAESILTHQDGAVETGRGQVARWGELRESVA